MDTGCKIASPGATIDVTSTVVGAGWQAITGHDAPAAAGDPPVGPGRA